MTTSPTTALPIEGPIKTFEDSMPLLKDVEALRARGDKDGCLFFRGLMPKDKVLSLRRQFIEIIRGQGWIHPSTNPDEAVAARGGVWEGKPDYIPALDAFQSLPAFHAMPHEPSIVGMFEKLFGEKVLVHPRNIGRIILPDAPATPPHQDYLYIKGATNTWTAWMPLGDAPRTIGGLAVRVGSHKSGFLPFKPMLGAGGSGIEEQHQTGEWHTIDYEPGDVVVFHSYNVHRGLPNGQGQRVRLSCDFRYQPMSDRVDRRSLIPHHGRFGWDHYYKNWPSEYDWLKFYWKDYPLEVVDDFDPRNKK